MTEEREVARCRFVDSHRIAVVLRPWTDEEENAFEKTLGFVLDDLRDVEELGLRRGGPDPRLAGVEPRLPEALGFAPQEASAVETEAARRSLGIEAGAWPHRMWDICWIDDSTIAGVHDGCQLELWNSAGRSTLRLVGEGHGVQLLPHAGRLLVHVLDRGDRRRGPGGATSTLYALAGDELQLMRSYDRAYAFSIGGSGRILARDTGDPYGHRGRADLILDGCGRTLRQADLGRYDCFNHYIRVDGKECLYFLQGTPPSSHEHKRLCEITPDGVVRDAMPWDPASGHFMEGTACPLPDGSIVIGYYVHNPRPGSGAAFVERRRLESSETLWRYGIAFPPGALEYVHSVRCVVAATLDGNLCALDLDTGNLRKEIRVTLDGAATAVTSLASWGECLAAGTLDGRAIIFRLRRGPSC